MNVWVIGRGYPTKFNSAKGSFEFEQAKMLAKEGCKVTYLALIFHPFKKIKKWGYYTWKENDITICTYSQIYFPERMRYYIEKFQKKKWKEFLGLVEKQCGIPDVIHVHYPTLITDAETIISYKKKKVKIVVTEHWAKVLTGEINEYERKRLNTYIDEASYFLCVGNPLKEAIKKISNTQRKIYVVPNIVSDEFRYVCPQRKQYYEFVTVGRLVKIKQFDKVIETFNREFGNEQKNVKLIIIGDGKERKELERIVKRNNLQNVVRFTGTLTREDTAKTIIKADALICYSRLETFGVPVIEAWACGKPVIASDRLGFLEYWKDELGEIVAWNDETSLRRAMRKIYDDRGYYFNCGEMISEYAFDKFGEKCVSAMLLKMYGQDSLETDEGV